MERAHRDEHLEEQGIADAKEMVGIDAGKFDGAQTRRDPPKRVALKLSYLLAFEYVAQFWDGVFSAKYS